MELRVLGPVELAVAGHPVPIRSPLQRTLLALLVADANRVVGVDRIVDALWGEEDWDGGHRRLWFHVSKLRGRLTDGEAEIERSGGGYRLRVEADRIDAYRFERLVDHARRALESGDRDASTIARQALGLWRGEPYEDVDGDAIGRAERVRLEELHLTAVELWLEAELAAGRADGVIPQLDKLIVDHPYRERLRGQLMRALWVQRRPSEALAVFAQTRALLDDELGIAPSAELRELAARIAAGSAPPPGDAPLPEQAGSARYGADGFVGRGSQLAQLIDAVRRSQREGATLQTVRGQAGVGKTRLLQALAARAEGDVDGLVAVIATCQAGSGPHDTFGPFRDIARRLDGDGSAAPAQMMTDIGIRRLQAIVAATASTLAATTLDAMERRRQPPPAGAIADWLRQMLDALAAIAPVLLVVDDVHWADGASVDLIRRLVTQVDHPLAIVAAYRPHELIDQAVRQLERDVQATVAGPLVIDLDRTGAAQRRAFVDALLDREPNMFDASFRALITRHSEGHALFAVELIDELRRRGAIRQDDGATWEHVGPEAWDGWPVRIHAVLESRFERVDEAVMAILRAASVQGETFVTSVVADVTGVAEAQVIEDLSRNAGEQHQLVAAVGADRVGHHTVYRYRFRHNLFQRFAYDSLDPVERAVLHGRVAAALAALSEGAVDDEWAVVLARHYEAAGDLELAVRHLIRAAQRAIRLAANEQAIGHVEHALRLLDDLPAGPGREELDAELHMQLGVARSIVDGFSAAVVEEAFERSVTLFAQAAPERRFPALFGLWVATASRAHFARSTPLVAELETAAAAADDDGLQVMALHARWTDCVLFGDLDGCLAAVDVGLELYRHERHHPLCYRYGNHDPAVCARSLGAVAAALKGDTVRAQRYLADGRALAEVLDHHPSRVQSMALASWVTQLSGDAAATLAAADEVLALEAGAGAVPLWFGLARFMRGWALMVDGHVGDAVEVLERELDTQRRMRTLSWMPVFATLLADAYLAADRPGDAMHIAVAGHDPDRPLYRSQITRVRAAAAAAVGQPVDLVEALTRSVREALADGAVVLALRSGLALAQRAPDVGPALVATVAAHLPAGHRSRHHTLAADLLASTAR